MLSGKTSQQGFTYIGLMLIVMVAGFAMAKAGEVWQQKIQREKELELLKIGDKFRVAIGQYYNNTPNQVKQFPPSLEALLKDERFPNPKRYLREIYADPFTNERNWGLVMGVDNGIMGVNSLSTLKPIKAAGFRPIYQYFQEKKTYAEWYFIYAPQASNLTN